MAESIIPVKNELKTYYSASYIRNVHSVLRIIDAYLTVSGKVAMLNASFEGTTDMTPPNNTFLFYLPTGVIPMQYTSFTVYCPSNPTLNGRLESNASMGGGMSSSWSFPIKNGYRYIVYGTFIVQ